MILQVGVKIFLKNPEGKYLLIRRSSKYAGIEGQLDIIGGRIDIGSPLLENLKREVFEETKLNIVGEPMLIYAQDILKGTEKHVVRLTYKGAAEGEPTLDEESTEYLWLTLEELRTRTDIDEFAKEVISKNLL
jgi:ADP-ribose pyrophosphatase YjhB (NUDIX family)